MTLGGEIARGYPFLLPLPLPPYLVLPAAWCIIRCARVKESASMPTRDSRWASSLQKGGEDDRAKEKMECLSNRKVT